MAETINITSLEQATSVPDDAVMPIVTKESDGSQKAKSILAKTFKGKDAYEVAVENGYSGTMAAWEEQCAKVGSFQVEFNPETGELEITI